MSRALPNCSCATSERWSRSRRRGKRSRRRRRKRENFLTSGALTLAGCEKIVEEKGGPFDLAAQVGVGRRTSPIPTAIRRGERQWIRVAGEVHPGRERSGARESGDGIQAEAAERDPAMMNRLDRSLAAREDCSIFLVPFFLMRLFVTSRLLLLNSSLHFEWLLWDKTSGLDLSAMSGESSFGSCRTNKDPECSGMVCLDEGFLWSM